jgi:hypothetical protein
LAANNDFYALDLARQAELACWIASLLRRSHARAWMTSMTKGTAHHL